MQLSPQSIRMLAEGPNPIISPFCDTYKCSKSGLSGGLTSAGYDVHMTDELLGLDAFDRQPVRVEGRREWVLPARTGCLAVTLEKFCIPQNMAMQYYNKSTLARKFLNAAATLGEPSWSGHLTLELYNQTDRPFVLYPGQPIGQVIFITLDSASVQPYDGKYQNQEQKPVEAR